MIRMVFPVYKRLTLVRRCLIFCVHWGRGVIQDLLVTLSSVL